MQEFEARRRFGRSIYNFFKFYQPLADIWNLYDNSTDQPGLIAKDEHGKLSVSNENLYREISQIGL